jgi:transposase
MGISAGQALPAFAGVRVSVGQIDITRTLAKVEDLLGKDRSLSPAARAMFELLVTIIHLLVAKLGLNSSNSSIPPSQDPKRKRGAKLKGNGRKPGGQKGHPGTTLEPVEDPDQTEPIAVNRRTIPPGHYKDAGYEARQVIDIVMTRWVIEYRAEILEDAHGCRFVAPFPAGVTRPVQYGQGVKVQAVYTSQQQLIPYDRIRDYFWDQCGIPISPGSIFRFNQEAYTLLEPFESFLVAKLVQQLLLHADETGIHINKTLYWLHCLCNENWTLFFPHAKRGGDAIKAMGVLEHFHGRLGHDHWKTYFQFDCIHFLCNAHHLRELEGAWEQDGQRWALKMQLLLLEIHNASSQAGGCLDQAATKSFRRRYRNILTRGNTECPAAVSHNPKRGRAPQSKSRNLLDRLRDFETETLRFMTDPLVPFTNNQCENDLRMTKVQQKISGCFRSLEGAQIFCRVRSYLSTCRKHNIQATEALQALFEGRLSEIISRLE